MSVPTLFVMPKNTLFALGLPSAENTYYQLPPEKLIQQNIERKGDVSNASKGTGIHPKECFIVKDSITADSVDWNELTHPIEEKYFDDYYGKMISHLGEKQIWIRDSYFSKDTAYKLSIRSVTEDPAGDLFVYNMFLHPEQKELENFNPDWYLIHTPAFTADLKTESILPESFTMFNFRKKVILIGGVALNEEIKELIFSLLKQPK